ncbi:MAG: hypothetical protein RLZZ299_2976 [Pseudomonadota bacterium]
MTDPTLTHAEIARYARHLLLPEVGPAGQARLKGASVVCVGSGGLGSPLLMYLAAAGVGRIGIVDFDDVDASNLQRQLIHGTAMVGRPKVESARARLADVNPHVQVDVHPTALRAANALGILAPYDVVVDGSDNFPTRYLVDDACVLLGKPNVYGSIHRFEGQASVFNLDGGPTYRDLYPQPPLPGAVPSCAEAGVFGVLPGIIGSIQAVETLKILLGIGETLSGRLLLFDALAMRFRELALRRDPAAPPVTHLVDYDAFCGAPAVAPVADAGLDACPATEVAARMAAGWAPFVLDVRAPAEAAIVSLPGTDLLVPLADLPRRLAEVPRDRDVLVVCKIGGRSRTAARLLATEGYRVVTLSDGILGWAEHVDPSLPKY